MSVAVCGSDHDASDERKHAGKQHEVDTLQAQQPAMPVIGYLGAESPAAFASRLRAFRQGLSETGYVEGRNVAIEFRWAEGQHNKLPALAAELAGRSVNVIVAPGGAPPALAAKSATLNAPI